MSGEETRPLVCPFCGAPQSAIVPSGTVQVKCKYCGGLILVPPWMGGEVHRCPNHPDRLATARCNDCGESFCDECLDIYTLKTQNESAVLYLCPDCLRKRRAEKANAITIGGISLIIVGVVAGFVVWPMGMVIGLIGVAFAVYGVSQGTGTAGEPTADEQQTGEEKKDVDVEEGFDEEAYDKLVAYYVNHWGASTGIGLLDNEITAYTRRGESFAYAVRKICERHEKDLRNT